MYPVLKKTTRILKFPDQVYVYEHHTGAERHLMPIGGYILALCTGQVSEELIAKCVSKTFGDVFGDPKHFVHNLLLGEYAPFINWKKEISAVKDDRYDFRDFAYHIAQPRRRRPHPISAQLILTNQCNFRCRYCFNSSGPEAKPAMETDDWLHAMDQMKEQGVISVDLTGGEPLMRKDLWEIISKAEACGFLITLFTNGSLITDEWVKRLATVPDLIVQVSLDSALPNIHHSMTDSRNSYDRVVHAIRELVEAGIHTRIKALMIPENYVQVKELIDLCADMGVHSLTLDTFDLSYVGRGTTDFFLNPEQIVYVKNIVDKATVQYGNRMPVSFTTGRKAWKDASQIIFCGALTCSFSIMADGTFTLCEKTAGSEECTVGHFPEMSISEMWNSPKIAEITTPPAECYEEPCRSCEHLERCHAGCPALRRIVRDKGLGPDPRCWLEDYPNNPFSQKIKEQDICIPY